MGIIDNTQDIQQLLKNIVTTTKRLEETMDDKMIIEIKNPEPKICATSEVQEIAKKAVGETINILQKTIIRQANDLCGMLDAVKEFF